MISHEKKGDLYFTLESYYYGMIPAACSVYKMPFNYWKIEKNGVEVGKYY